ncbi:MAG: hypothetical protein KDE53_25250 [Caldilineaceae bacterium]|nr:hypothetical protein [Caldilineaceae bacterium]
MSKVVAKLLTDTQIALHSAQSDPEISALLTQYGYNPETLAEGVALYEAAANLHHGVAANYGRQYAATDRFQEQWRTVNAVLKRQRQIARVAFRTDRDRRHRLALATLANRSFANWIAMATQFYDAALKDEAALNRLAQFGLTQETLVDNQAKVLALVEEKSRQSRRVGNARQMTNKRNSAVKALRHWLRDFIDICRLALVDNPQALAKLGALMLTTHGRRARATQPEDQLVAHGTSTAEDPPPDDGATL